MKIGILQAGHLSDELRQQFGSYPALYTRLLDGYGFTFQAYAVVDGVFPDTANDADGWLITGSKHGAYEDIAFIAQLERLIREAYDVSVPIVGICFGHQILAQALGGVVEKFDGGWSVGRTEYQMQGADQAVSVLAWHQDQVVRRPKDAKLIGSSPFCENAALVYGDKAYSIQPHPEFSDDFVAALMRTRGKGIVPQPLLDTAVADFGKPLSNRWVADQIADFFKQSRRQEHAA